jgi:hypothetical protein
MKKALLLTVAVASLAGATAVSAETRLGAVGFTDGGAGLFVSGDKFIGSAVVNSLSQDDDFADSTVTQFELSGAARVAKSGNASLLAGVSVATAFNDSIDSALSIAATAGVEYALSSDVKLLATIDVLRSSSITFDNDLENKTTEFFNAGRVGVAYLF